MNALGIETKTPKKKKVGKTSERRSLKVTNVALKKKEKQICVLNKGTTD